MLLLIDTWTPPSPEELARLQELSDEELVPIHYMTDEDVRQPLDEFEEQYGISSEEFYKLWQQGEADYIAEKTGWLILYEDWQRTLVKQTQVDEL